jgi:polysaccharide export outer membrane protein
MSSSVSIGRSVFVRMAHVMAGLALLVAGAASAKEYTLEAGDVIRVTVYDNADLNTTARINQAGRISFPLIGEVRVSEISPEQAATRIAELLKKGGFIANPHVNVFVERYRSPTVSILGEVQRPGKFPVRDPTGEDIRTVSDLLAMSGGLTANAADYMTLIKKGAEKTAGYRIDLIALLQRGDMSQNLAIAEGDVVYVPRMEMFYIYGEVTRPGAFRLEREMTLMQALAVGGGLTPRGTQRGIEVRRRNGDGTVRTIRVKLTDTLQPEDVVYVKESLF